MLLKKKEIDELFEAFDKLNVLLIGDVMIDAYIWGKVERISPEAPVPVVAVNKRENRLGGAANVAKNLRSLGANIVLCTVIGDDEKGQTLQSLLTDWNISDKGVIKSAERVTTTKFRIIGNNTQLLRVDEEIEDTLSDSDTEKLWNSISSILDNEKFDIILFQDYDKGTLSPKLIEKVVEKANKLAIPTIVDPKKKNFTNYNGVTLFKPNLKELAEGLDIDFSHDFEQKIIDAANILHKKHQIKKVMITLSERGIFISDSDNNSSSAVHKFIPAHIRNITDVSGAGDTVVSIASLCLANKLDFALTATIANLAGGLICEEVGVVPINKEKLKTEVLRIFN